MIGPLDSLWRDAVFFAGDVRRLSSWPYVTWSKDEHLVSYEEIAAAIPHIRYGDIGLHRDRGYLSNLGIPGFMKHAWIHVRDIYGDFEDERMHPWIVEAVSEGVVCRSPVYPMHSDYVIVLKPTTPSEEGLLRYKMPDKFRKGACLKARRMVGQPYDHRFEFNIEEELKYYQGQERDRRGRGEPGCDLANSAVKQFRDFDVAFSCTELVAYAWWHLREQLGIERRERYGKQVILADSFINRNWRIRWASESVTADVARNMGLGDEGVSMIEGFRRAA